MKKKIIATLFIAIIATSAFLMGHATTANRKNHDCCDDVNRLEYRLGKKFL